MHRHAGNGCTLSPTETILTPLNIIASGINADETHTLKCWDAGATLTYSLAALDRMARRVAHHLTQSGLRHGDRIGICAKNSLAWVLLDLAAIKTGIQTAGFEPGRYAGSSSLLDTYGLARLFTDEPDGARGVVAIDTIIEAATTLPDSEPEETVHYAPTDCTTVKFTSGSTGTPKGLEATVASTEASLQAVQQILAHGPGDDLFVFLPLSLLQQRFWIYSALVFGHNVTLTSFERSFAVLPLAKPTVIMGVPGFYEALKRHIEMQAESSTPDALREAARRCVGPRLRYMWTGSAPASRSVLDFFDTVGLPIFEGYGMNETCIVSKNHPGASRRGSVGKVLPHKRVRIDENGELYVGSTAPVNTRYLFGQPGASENVFMANGEVRTGDLARVDDDGYLYILGRRDDIVVLANGKNIFTRPIEQRIAAFPHVQQCVLLGAGLPYLVTIVVLDDATDAEARVQASLSELNRTLPREHYIGRLIVAREAFSVENGQMSVQFKPRRQPIAAAYADEIEAQPLERTLS